MTPNPVPDDAGADQTVETVLHAERLQVAVEQYATERIRIRKVIVTEQRTVTLTLRREELRITREPLDAGEPVPGVDDPQPAEIVVVLHEERPVITLETRPVERVRIARHIETDVRTESRSVRRERADIVPPGSADPASRI